ncbi:MAG: lipase family protein [Pseudomonadota bacterium]|nr:lipase family protein [Pseudomonadota bacterium]
MGVMAISVMLAVGLYFAAVPQQPSAFYQPPQPLPKALPGSVIRQASSHAKLPEGARAWRVMYLSTDEQGKPLAVTGTVVAPDKLSSTPRPVVAWAHGTTGIRPECGVSHTRDPYQQTPDVAGMLAQGWVVAITDYPGLGTPGIHPYMVGRTAAHSVLDMVRAAEQIPESGAGSSFVVWGASQGGNTAFWVGQLAADYAPELTLKGVAASAPALNLRKIAAYNQDKPAGGIFMGMVFAAWDQVYAEASLQAILKPDAADAFQRMIRPCFTAPAGFLPALADLRTPQEYLAVDILATPPWPGLFDHNSPDGPIAVPMVIAHGTADALIPIALSEQAVSRRSRRGETIQIIRLPGVGHDARDESAGYLMTWVQERFEGQGPTR